MGLTLAIGQATDPGRVRQSNEDGLCVLQTPAIVSGIDALIAVADGMGGHNAGEVASGFVTEKLNELFRSPEYRKWVDFSPEREDYYVLVLKEVLEKLNDQLHQMALRREEWRGMGTTVTVGLIAGGKAYLGHVGDSRAYLLSQDTWRQLTKDHAWVMEQVEQGLLSPEQAAVHPRKNEITRALGISSLVRVDRHIQDLGPGDALLLCTDGLTNLVSDSEMQHCLQSVADPQQCCQALVQLANQRGGGDNISVVIARVRSESPVSGAVVAPPLNQTAADVKIDTEPILVQPRRLWQRSKLRVPTSIVPELPASNTPDAIPISAPVTTDAAEQINSAAPVPAATPVPIPQKQPPSAKTPTRENPLTLFMIGFFLIGYVFLAAAGNAWLAVLLDWKGPEVWIPMAIIGAATWILLALGLLFALGGFFYLFNRR